MTRITQNILDNAKTNYFVFRVFNEDFSFDNYNDVIYRTSENEINPKFLKAEYRIYSGVRSTLEDIWNAMYNQYTGYTYCMKEIIETKPDEYGKYTEPPVIEILFTGGILDPNDIDNLNDYINETRNDPENRDFNMTIDPDNITIPVNN